MKIKSNIKAGVVSSGDPPGTKWTTQHNHIVVKPR